MEHKNNTPEFVRSRITELRLKRGVSEYQMSYDLGHSRGYINNISNGNSLPSMTEFLSICDYFGMTPEDFFRQEQRYSATIQKIVRYLETLPSDELNLMLSLAEKQIKRVSG